MDALVRKNIDEEMENLKLLKQMGSKCVNTDVSVELGRSTINAYFAFMKRDEETFALAKTRYHEHASKLLTKVMEHDSYVCLHGKDEVYHGVKGDDARQLRDVMKKKTDLLNLLSKVLFIVKFG